MVDVAALDVATEKAEGGKHIRADANGAKVEAATVNEVTIQVVEIRIDRGGVQQASTGTKNVGGIPAVSPFFLAGHPLRHFSNHEGCPAGGSKCCGGTKQFSKHIGCSFRAGCCTQFGPICLHTTSKSTCHFIYCLSLPLFK
jgi:hypothetical protein